MYVLFALVNLILTKWAQCDSFTTYVSNWDQTQLKNENGMPQFEICPEEAPRCPGKAEPRCTQSPHSVRAGSPPQGNTEWKCVLCEETTEGTVCFTLLPTETYSTKLPQKWRISDAMKKNLDGKTVSGISERQNWPERRGRFRATRPQNSRVRRPLCYQSYFSHNYDPYYGQSVLNPHSRYPSVPATIQYARHPYLANPRYINDQFQSIVAYL